MINLKINNRTIQVEEGTSLLEAAESIGISIPTMCYMKGFHNHPSCMICMVKDIHSGKLLPSCGTKAEEGMEIITEDEDIVNSRKESLELLLSDHVGDCEAPCKLACPAFMDIPEMNRLIAAGKFNESLIKVKEEIAIPLILGYICPAPCESACRRKQIDEPVSVCLLKRFVAAEDISSKSTYFPNKEKTSGKKVTIIGTGPAGLAAAFYLLKSGHQVTLYDRNDKPGGTLRYASLNHELPEEVLDEEINIIKKYGAKFLNKKLITKELFDTIRKENDAVILAMGELGLTNLKEFGLNYKYSKTGVLVEKGTYVTDEPGVFACGNVIRTQKMAVRSVAQGKSTAIAVDQFLSGEKPVPEERMFSSKFGKLLPEEFDEYLKESSRDKRYSPQSGDLYGFSAEEAIREAKRCMHCDCRKMDDCKLRIYANEYKADRKKYWPEDRKKITKQYQHENVVYEPEKCIKCGLCIEIVEKEMENTGLAYIGRGFNVQINIPFNKTLNVALTKTAEKCVISCPTAALSFKKKKNE